jgi:uncharacterized membrane protein
MITAALTAIITFVLRQFGIELSVAQIAGVAATVKVVLVILGAVFGGRLLKKRLDAAKAEKANEGGSAPEVEPKPPKP